MGLLVLPLDSRSAGPRAMPSIPRGIWDRAWHAVLPIAGKGRTGLGLCLDSRRGPGDRRTRGRVPPSLSISWLIVPGRPPTPTPCPTSCPLTPARPVCARSSLIVLENPFPRPEGDPADLSQAGMGGTRPQEIWFSSLGVAIKAIGRAKLRARDIAGIGITNQRNHGGLGPRHRGTRGQCDRLAGSTHCGSL